MHVGLAAVFQNPKKARSDIDVYRNELRLAAEAEPLGFESVWGVEHHFTDYTMCPDVLQFLTYMAGRTQRAQLGSMVVVLPWHDPLRVAEEVSMLDNISDGRLILGLRSEEHTSELQSRLHLVCRLLLEKKKKTKRNNQMTNKYASR